MYTCSEENKKRYTELGEKIEDILINNQKVEARDLDTLYLLPELNTLLSKLTQLEYYKSSKREYRVLIRFSAKRSIDYADQYKEFSDEENLKFAIADEVKWTKEITTYNVRDVQYDKVNKCAVADITYDYLTAIEAFSEEQALRLAENTFCPENIFYDIKDVRVLRKSIVIGGEN